MNVFGENRAKPAMRGMVWTGAEKVLVQGMGFVQGVILARLLRPHDFGLAAMLGLFLSLGSALAETGLGTAYVVYGGDARRVFAWNVGVGAAIYAVLAASAPWIAGFYGEPALKPLTWIMGAGMVAWAACVAGNARLQREGRFAVLSCINVAACVFAFVTGVSLAWLGWGVWAIAWAGLLATVFRFVALSLATRRLAAPCAGGEAGFGRLLSYGWKLVASGVAGVVYTNAFQLTIGRLFAPASVGLFTRAQRWAALPAEAANESVARVALPGMARGKGSARRYMVLNALMLWPALAVLCVFGREITAFVLGEAWVGCVPYMRILALGVFFSPVSNVSMRYTSAKGRSDLILLGDVVKRPVQFALLAAGVWFASESPAGGIERLCWVKAAGDAVEAAISASIALRLRRRNGA